MRLPLLLTAAGVLLAIPAVADPTAEELMKKYDQLMGPENFESVARMTAHRDDGSTRAYKMLVLKKGDDKLRLTFQEPAAVVGQEMLRQGDNFWVYMPNLKRAIRLANRESFQGGDFNNADVLRVKYQADYTGSVVADPARADAWLLELKAKTTNASYDKIKLWMRKADLQPVLGEYYTASGKLLRKAEFSEYKNFGGLTRPGKIVMRNMLATARYSEMKWDTLNTNINPPPTKFLLDDLGK
ncbi:MAG: outer membrane lipoprotein-sorting protein [Deltaproteobacteria bacterium]|nr:outer membrane lipoprotein-sorting protein [Deltaproteobacteria bacterium]